VYKSLRIAVLTFMLVMASGCGTVGWIRTKLVRVHAVPEAGTPAVVNTSSQVSTLTLPKGSEVTVTKLEALPGTPATPSSPAIPAQPAKEVTEVKLADNAQLTTTAEIVHASTGTIDTAVAEHKIDEAAKQPLLFAAIGAALAAIVFLWLKYPTPALISGIASIAFFMAWNMPSLPSWFYEIGIVGLVISIGLWLGHEKGEIFATTSTPAK